MKIVIDISAEDFEKVKCGRGAVSMMRRAIIHGTPLPEGHGRLIDADEFEELFGKMCPSDCGACAPKRKTDGRGRWYDTCSLIDVAPTVIEADTESEGKYGDV